jgi:hypothetical protein
MPPTSKTPSPASPRPYTKTEQVLTTMTKGDRDRLDAYAASIPTSRADAARHLILLGLDAHESGEDL